MKIIDLDFYLVELPRSGTGPPLRTLLVRLASDTDLEGWGEGSLPWRPDELPARRRYLLPDLAGRNVFDVEELLCRESLAEPPLRSAVETACWDLIGQAAGLPLHSLWGGLFRRRVPTAYRLNEPSTDEASHVARELAEQGFFTLIVSSSGDTFSDVETVEAIRELTFDRAELLLDLAGRYGFDDARELCLALPPGSVRCVLDPLASSDPAELAQLTQQTRTPLGVWRAIHGPAEILALARAEAARFIVVSPDRIGGLQAARRCAAVAEAAGLAASLASLGTAGVACAAAAHVAAATPSFNSAHEFACVHATENVLAEPLEIVDGLLTVPLGPGLGVTIDRTKLEEFQAV